MDKDKIEQQYLKLTKIFANIAGTWPYQKRSLKLIMLIYSNLVTISTMYTQIAYIAHVRELNALTEVPFIILGCGVLLKQTNYFIYTSKLKLLLNGMYEDWKVNKSEEEIMILKTYAKRANYFASFYIVAASFTAIIFISMPFIPRVLDKLIPLNESRDLLFAYNHYYGWNEEEYFNVVVVHMALFILLALFVYTSVDSIFIHIVQHACGLLEVSGHRFKYAVENFSSNEKKIMDPAEEVYKRVCHSIQAHERAITYLNDTRNIHMIYFLIFMGLVIMSFTVSLYKLTTIEINGNVEGYFYCVFLFIQLVHIFFTVLQGQFVINATDDIYDKIYEGLWYNAPPKTQSLYLFALRRTLTPPEISAGGIITFDLMCFSAIIKTSVSYFMVLQST